MGRTRGKQARKDVQHEQSRQKRKARKQAASKRGSGASARCTCTADGGFAEHLPDDVWLASLRRRAKCPIHGGKG